MSRSDPADPPRPARSHHIRSLSSNPLLDPVSRLISSTLHLHSIPYDPLPTPPSICLFCPTPPHRISSLPIPFQFFPFQSQAGVRPIIFLKEVLDYQAHHPDQHDQQSFNQILSELLVADVSVAVMHPRLFPNGFQARHQSIVHYSSTSHLLPTHPRVLS